MIWLIGNKGMLGTELSNMIESRGWPCVGTDRDVDITDRSSLDAFAAKQAASGNKIDWIINCAAFTAVDKAEDEPVLCRRLNAEGPANVAACAKKIGATLLHISTDYVFNGNGSRPYREDDPTDPTGVYGLTKRDGEIAAFAANDKTYIIRTAWLYGRHGNNFVFTMLKIFNEQASRMVVTDQRGTPTWAYVLCTVICAFYERSHSDRPATYGIYHFSGKGDISWNDFAHEIYRKGTELGLVNNVCEIKPCTSDLFPAKVRRPPYSVLDKTKIERELGIIVPDWQESLSKFLSGVSMRKLTNILVTGGAGFIGCNFIHVLLQKTPGFTGKIINLDALTYAGNAASLADIETQFGGKRYFFEHGDITDRTRVEEVFAKYDIDTVIHFAAESHVDRSILGPEAFIKTNVMGTFTLLDVARRAWTIPAGQKGEGTIRQDVLFHHISTDEVYGSLGDTGFFTETTPYDPRSPYSASKASSDHLVFAYYHTYGLPVTLSNCSNNYGPYHFPEKLIPLMILNILDGKPLPVYGDGKNIRDWLFVEDHNTAVWTIVNKGKTGEKYNIGGENEWENITLLQKLIDIVAVKAKLDPAKIRETITYVKDRPGHDRRYAIDCSKLKRELGWRQSVSFEQGLERTVDWYLANTEWVQNVKSGDYKNWVERNYTGRK
jgi:dTDP-glucose 4,6-dehydratase